MRRLLLLGTAPWVFRSPRHTARKLRSLAATEQGSFLSLQWAAAQTTSTKRQSSYLRHATDEARHARLFWGRAGELAPPSAPLRADGEDLFAALGELGFLAFVHHAEARGREQFLLYARYFERVGREPERALFARIAREEKYHENYSLRLLEELATDAAEVRKTLRRVRLWEAWRAWRRVGRRMAYGIYVVVLWLLMPLLWPYSLVIRLVSPAPSGWQGTRDREVPATDAPRSTRG